MLGKAERGAIKGSNIPIGKARQARSLDKNELPFRVDAYN
jgi:hypothetical protein